MQPSKIKLFMSFSSLPHEILFFKTLLTTLSQSLTSLSCLSSQVCQTQFRLLASWTTACPMWRTPSEWLSFSWSMAVPYDSSSVSSKPYITVTITTTSMWTRYFFGVEEYVGINLKPTTESAEVFLSMFYQIPGTYSDKVDHWNESVIKINGWLKPKRDDSSYSARKYTTATMHFVYCTKSQPLLRIRRLIVSPPVANVWHSVFCLYSFFDLEVITSVKGCAGDASLQYCTLLPEHKYTLAEVYLAPCLGLSSLSSQMLSLVRSFALYKLYLSHGSLCVLKGISPDWVKCGYS